MDATSTEVLFMAMITAAAAEDARILGVWAARVAALREGAELEKSKWKPPTGEHGWPTIGKVSKLFEPLQIAYEKTEWDDATLNHIGAAIMYFQGEGQYNGLTHTQLREALRNGGKACLGVRADFRAASASSTSRSSKRVFESIGRDGGFGCRRCVRVPKRRSIDLERALRDRNAVFCGACSICWRMPRAQPRSVPSTRTRDRCSFVVGISRGRTPTYSVRLYTLRAIEGRGEAALATHIATDRD